LKLHLSPLNSNSKNKKAGQSFSPIRGANRENLARIYSVEEETTLTYLDLIRRAIQEKYVLEDG